MNQHESVRLDPPPPQPVVSIAASRPTGEASEDRVDRNHLHIGTCDESEKSAPFARFSIVHVNDLQARYSDRIEGRSRYAYVAGYIADVKRQAPNALVLDAGDDYEKGSLTDLRSMGEATRQMIQSLGIDARVIGNHDFSYGEAAVRRDVTESRHPVLAANLRRVARGNASADDAVTPLERDEKDQSSGFLPYVQIDVGCVKVGILGLVTQNYGADDQPTREPFCGVWEQDGHYADVASKIVAKHRGEVDVMIALTHIGLFEDAVLAQLVPALDLVVGGHTEDLLREPRPAIHQDGTITWIMQAGHYGETIGRADLVVSKRERAVGIDHYHMTNVTSALPADDAVAKLAQKLERKYTPGLGTMIGTAAREVKPGKEMADLLYAAVASEWGADALLVGKDAFWGGLGEGPFSLQRLYDAVLVQREPTGTSGFTSLYTLELTGRELLALRASYINGPLYEFYVRDGIRPEKTYRFVIEKRALTYPFLAFREATAFPKARFGGEIIDALESYARTQTKRGAPVN